MVKNLLEKKSKKKPRMSKHKRRQEEHKLIQRSKGKTEMIVINTVITIYTDSTRLKVGQHFTFKQSRRIIYAS